MHDIKKIINTTFLSLMAGVILFITGFFFLGSRETYEAQLKEVPKYFAGRALLGFAVGVFGTIFLSVVNWFLYKSNDQKRRSRLIRLIIIATSVSAIAAIIGTTFFFGQ